MEVFVVVQEGAYRHDIAGVFTTLDAAIEAAIARAEVDGLGVRRPDGYHSWPILRFDTDLPVDDGERVGRVGYAKPGRYQDSDTFGAPLPLGEQPWLPPEGLGFFKPGEEF